MIIFIFYAMFLFWSISSMAGQECDISIRDGNAAQDLDRILRCFNQRIEILETENQKAQARVEEALRAAENAQSCCNGSKRSYYDSGAGGSVDGLRGGVGSRRGVDGASSGSGGAGGNTD